MDFDVAFQHFKFLFFGAENETRTRDPDLGKVVLYQLSYFRVLPFVLRVGLEPTRPCGQGILSPSCLPFHHQSLSLSDLGDLSGKRDSNSRPRPWQGRALPTELFPHLSEHFCFQKRVQKYKHFSNWQNNFYVFDTIFFISLSFNSASIGVSVLISISNSLFLISSNVGSSSWIKLS